MSQFMSLLLSDCNESEAIVYPKKISYKKLRHLVLETGKKLLKLVPFNGDNDQSPVVALLLHNTIEFVVVYYAILSLGWTCAPLNPEYKEHELTFYIKDLEPSLFILPQIISYGFQEWRRSNRSSAGIVQVHFDGDTLSWEILVKSIPLAVRNDCGNALILHTSGSTGKPKAIPITLTSIVCSVNNIIKSLSLQTNDVCHLLMPLFHVHGLIGCLMSTLLSGGSVVVHGKFSASKFMPLMKEFKCTWYSAVPTIHEILSRQKWNENIALPHLRFVRSCSASLAASTAEKLKTMFNVPIVEAYAMTEAAHQMSSNPLWNQKLASVGVPQGIEMSILNEGVLSREPNNVGEIAIRGPTVFNGYLNNPNANVDSFVQDKSAVKWFRTGDVGFFDEDGYLFITGRIKEMINRGGEKIAPIEIDHVLESNTCVKEAISFGIPDLIYGQLVVAVVVTDSEITENDLKAYCRTKLASFKVPTKIYFVKEIPRTATGKIQRLHIANQFINKSNL